MRVKAWRWLASTTFATSSLVVACSNSYSGGGFGFGGSSGSGGFFDSGSSEEPEHESFCDKAEDGFQCLYMHTCEKKQHPNIACNAALRCDGDLWELEEPAKTSCASDCPLAYVEERPDGCAGPNVGTLQCEYPEGTCGCAPVRPPRTDGGDGGDEETEDAGHFEEADADAGPTTYVWTCVKPNAGCPRTRPRSGGDCVKPMACDYGDCVFEDGVTMRCTGQTWVSEKRCDVPKDDP